MQAHLVIQHAGNWIEASVCIHYLILRQKLLCFQKRETFTLLEEIQAVWWYQKTGLSQLFLDNLLPYFQVCPCCSCSIWEVVRFLTPKRWRNKMEKKSVKHTLLTSEFSRGAIKPDADLRTAKRININSIYPQLNCKPIIKWVYIIWRYTTKHSGYKYLSKIVFKHFFFTHWMGDALKFLKPNWEITHKHVSNLQSLRF